MVVVATMLDSVMVLYIFNAQGQESEYGIRKIKIVSEHLYIVQHYNHYETDYVYWNASLFPLQVTRPLLGLA